MAGVLHYEEDRGSRTVMKVLPPSPPQQDEPCYRRLSGPALSQVQEEPVSTESVQPGQPPVQPGEEDVRKRGYLRKQKHGHKRYFVLRTHSHLGPARLEYYDNEKKFRSGQRPGGGGAGCPPKRVIFLSQCFTVSRRADAKNKHLLALYTKDEYFAMVAESEPEQDSWYQALAELIHENKKSCLDPEELEDHYGGLRSGPVFKEVWQVNVKPRGLGQTKNLSGVYRLCLSNKAVHLVKLSSDVACVHLLLMNIRRCGHSENYFFIEVGRSSSTGAGELWMQVDDCVVAQNMHETFLETMKALKAYSEFRPRSKSQSSGTNPISFITTRRYLGNLPPSQTGLQRRSRTESVTGTPPTTKNNAYRFRTSSEGEGTMTRPFRSVTGSLIHLNTARINLGKQEGTGRYVRAPFNSGYHSRSASLPVSHFPSATSPISVCSSSGHGSASETLTRPSSSSVCGSPTDGGFISSDEYGSSPGDLRYFRVRSNTPDSLGNTPPIQEENTLSDYMSMSSRHQPNGRDDYMEADKCFRKRTYSLTKPTNATLQQHKSQAAASLDEDSEEVNKQFAYSESPKLKDSNHPEDYSNGLIDSVCNQSRSKAKDDGYMPMMPSISYDSDYLPMAPKSVSAPKQIVSMCPSQVDAKGYMMMFPVASSPVRNSLSGSGSKGNQEKVANGEYMDMSYRNSSTVKQTNDTDLNNSRGFSSYFSLPRSFKGSPKPSSDHNEYVPMSSPGKLLHFDLVNATDGESKIDLKSSTSVLDQQVRATRPTKLTLAMRGSNTIPRMFDHSNSTEPTSPGEYINIDFSDKASSTPYSLSAEGSPSSLGSSCDHRHSPLSDYMSVDIDVQSPKATAELSNSLTDISSYSCSGISRIQPSAEYAKLPCGTACISATDNRNDDYTTMTFNMAMTPPRPFPSEAENGTQLGSPSSIVDRLCIGDMTSFNSGFPSVLHPVAEPVVGPKVIRADAQGRRRHSSETFSSASTVTTTSTCFTESGKRHSSASFDNVWLKPDEGTCDQEKKISKHCSTGFQHGLNYIALSMHDGVCETASPACSQHQNGSRNLENGAYVSIDFTRSDCLKCSTFRKD